MRNTINYSNLLNGVKRLKDEDRKVAIVAILAGVSMIVSGCFLIGAGVHYW